MPTFCEIAKVECPTTDGISFLPELLGKKQNKHDFLYWEFPDSGGQKAVRMGKWKGIVLNILKETGKFNYMIWILIPENRQMLPDTTRKS